MLVFVIPLKSPKVAKSWSYVSGLFERCLRSVCNQSAAEFHAIVVCHERPQIDFSDPRVSYIDVDFAVPDSLLNSLHRDKRRKVLTGLIRAREYRPSHVMIVDADDCVSRRLSEFVGRNPRSHGWYIENGYVYQDGSERILFKGQNFYRWCGTCNIVRYDLLDLPPTPDDPRTVLLPFGHAQVKETLAVRGTPLAPLPFPGAVYVNSKHGEGTFARRTFFSKLKDAPRAVFHAPKLALLNLFESEPLTDSIRAEFGLYPL